MTPNRETDSELFDTAAYVCGSRYRMAVVRTLERGPTAPSRIADGNDVALSHVGRALSELREKNLVHSHSDGSRSKLYTLTDRGERLVAVLDRVEGDG